MTTPDNSPGFGDAFRRISIPFSPEILAGLQAGDLVSLTGSLFTGRDQTHRRLKALIDEASPLPFDPRGQLLYYVGPSPAREGRAVGAAGPTTSYRMDTYTPDLLAMGLAADDHAVIDHVFFLDGIDFAVKMDFAFAMQDKNAMVVHMLVGHG